MKTKLTFYQYLTHAKELLKQGHDMDSIAQHLKDEGANTDTLIEITQFLQPHKRNKNQTGSLLILAGALLLVAGFFGSILFTEDAAILNFTLYGLTGLGIIILIVGVAMIFH